MRPLLQHAPRSFLFGSAMTLVASTRLLGGFVPEACLRCQYRAVSTALRKNMGVRSSFNPSEKWSKRAFSSSRRWMEEGKPFNSSPPIQMPPPASESRPTRDARTVASEAQATQEREERMRREFEAAEKLRNEEAALQRARSVPETPPPVEAQKPIQQEATPASTKDDVADNIARVPDEQLPSHRHRQRWSLSKRFSNAMDELLPKLALVGQKVNTYTGTDYSGVEALRREIKEQEKLVKARRSAIDTHRQALDTALAHQASSQKEVVALLERKHSWSNSDLERYMALIRSEHINDQAVREGKDAVANAETALEDARAQLEKRERAQYHEEQIWSDTIRRNSTWVTFGLMGVNIFLLLLSLAILEPYRRRRMVREIKTALESQLAAMESGPSSVAVPAANDIAVLETKDAGAVDNTVTAVGATTPPIQAPINPPPAPAPAPVGTTLPESITNPTSDPAVPGAAPLTPPSSNTAPQESISIPEELSSAEDNRSTFRRWQDNAAFVVQDVVSDRVISIRRIDYTAAVLQGAAAGAVITAAVVAFLSGQ